MNTDYDFEDEDFEDEVIEDQLRNEIEVMREIWDCVD